MNYFVSIIVPVYKVPEKFLRKCIDSLMRQTLREIQIILIDDGSLDYCGEICDGYAGADSRVKVIHKRNEGLAAARNSGFLEATGKWVMFVDGDDWIDTKMCEVMYNKGTEENLQLVMCGITKEYGHTSSVYKINLQDNVVYNKEECKTLQAMMLSFDSRIACVFAKLIKRDFLVENRLLHDKVLRQGAEGIEFNLRVFEKLEKTIFIRNSFYHYIFNPDSISAKYDEKNNEYVLNCFIKIREFIKSSYNRKELLSNFYDRLVYITVTTAISGFFNPENKDKYLVKVEKCKHYIERPIIKDTIQNCNLINITFIRRITFELLKRKMFLLVCFIAFVRRKQLLAK